MIISLLAHIWNSQSPNYQVTEGPRTRLNCRHFTNCFINSLATKSHAFFHHQIRAWKPDVDTIVSDNAKYGGKQIISVTPRLYDYILGNVREPEVSPDQAQLLAMLVQVQGAKRCIEVGIYTEDAFIPDWQQWTFFIRYLLSDSYILEHGKSVW